MDKLIDKLNRIDCTHADAKEAAARIRLLEAEVEALRQAQSEVCGKLWKFVGTDIDADGRDCADLAIERATTAEAQLAAERERAEKQPHFIIAEADLPTKEQVYDLFMEWCYQPGCSGEQVDFAMRVLTQMGLCREGE